MFCKFIAILCCVIFSFSSVFAAQPSNIYLRMPVTTSHGVVANCWAVTGYNTRYVKRWMDEPGGKKERYTEVKGAVSLWVNNDAMVAEKSTLMSCVFDYTIDGKIKDFEAEIYQRILTIPEDGKSNDLRCGQEYIGFQNAVIITY